MARVCPSQIQREQQAIATHQSNQPPGNSAGAIMSSDPHNLTAASEATNTAVSQLADQALNKHINHAKDATELPRSLATTPTSKSTPKSKQNETPEFTSVTTSLATEREDLIAALKLIAESIAQQRQTAARSILHHWLSWITMGTILSAIVFVMYNSPSDYGRIILTSTGALMTFLLLTRISVAGYLDLAEETGTWKWLYGPDTSLNIRCAEKWRNYTLLKSHQVDFERAYDIVLVARYQNAIVATLVMRVVRCDEPAPASELTCTPVQGLAGQKHAAFIRALTVAYRYRYLGIGGALLRVAVMMWQENGWMSIEFANRHALSPQVLPRHFVFSSRGLNQAWVDRLRALVEEYSRGVGVFPWVLDEDYRGCDGRLPEYLRLGVQFERLRESQVAGELLLSGLNYSSARR